MVFVWCARTIILSGMGGGTLEKGQNLATNSKNWQINEIYE